MRKILISFCQFTSNCSFILIHDSIFSLQKVSIGGNIYSAVCSLLVMCVQQPFQAGLSHWMIAIQVQIWMRMSTRPDPKKFYLFTGCSLPSSTKKKIFLAFEGRKGRKAKKGQNFPKNKYGTKKCLKLLNSVRNPIKNFGPYEIYKGSWLSVKGQKAVSKI